MLKVILRDARKRKSREFFSFGLITFGSLIYETQKFKNKFMGLTNFGTFLLIRDLWFEIVNGNMKLLKTHPS